MRGGVGWDDLMFNIDTGDREIFIKIIKNNWETTQKSGMPLV